MRLWRGLRAAGLAIVAVALIGPATAGAEELWWYDHDFAMYPVSNGKKPVTPFGYDFMLIGAKDEYGPCEEFQVSGELHNEYEGMGEGTLQSLMSKAEKCPTNVGGCTVDELTPTGFPWSLTLTANKKVVILGIDIEVKLNKACEKTELPLTSTASGTVEGIFQDYIPPENPEEEGHPATVVIDDEPGLTAAGLKVTLDGRIKFGTRTTALPEPAGEVFTAAQYPVDLHGVQSSPSTFEISSRKLECKGVTTKGELFAIAEILKLTTPAYSECTTNPLGLPGEVVTECSGFEEHYDSVLGFTFSECTAGFVNQVVIYDSKKESIVCLFEADEPINGQTVSYANLGGTKGVSITREFENVGYTRIVGSTLLCGPATATATIKEVIALAAKNLKKEAVAFEVG